MLSGHHRVKQSADVREETGHVLCGSSCTWLMSCAKKPTQNTKAASKYSHFSPHGPLYLALLLHNRQGYAQPFVFLCKSSFQFPHLPPALILQTIVKHMNIQQ